MPRSPKDIRTLIDMWSSNPYQSLRCGNVKCDESGKLWSYGAIIARPIDRDTMWVNPGRYSVTTSRHTNMARRMAKQSGFIINEDKII